MAVLRPLKLVIDNYPEDQVEEMEAKNHPQDASFGTRRVPFSREVFIERDDFMEDPPRKFYRLAPGREVRLRYAYLVTCTDVVKDETGEVVEVHCRYDPETRGGDAPDGRKVRGTLHWVSAAHGIPAEVRVYGHLFATPDPSDAPEGEDYTYNLRPDSLEILDPAWLEPAMGDACPGDRFQFERRGYYCVDSDSTDDKLVLNQTVALRDTWAKLVKRGRTG
jgi:glutaminyl-tRNA synthetase